jgi:Tol biopolymer transport system component
MPGMSLRPGEVFAGYTVERELGAGGMGSVYLARHPRLPRFDALKLLRSELCADPGFVGRFEREADTVAQLDHPNIVPVYDRGSQDGQLWISMRFIDGSNAENALSDYAQGGMPPDRAVRIVSKVASALDYAHRHQLLHRDVKPANILLTPGSDDDEEAEQVFLSDFGVAKAIGEAAERISSLTSTGSVVATLDYASPEQIKGQVLDHRTDIYALGCVLYKLLTGTVPYPGESIAARVYGHLNSPPPAPSAVVPALPVALDQVTATALAKEPADRYPSCRALAVAARAALAGSIVPLVSPEVAAAGAALPTTVNPIGGLEPAPFEPAPVEQPPVEQPPVEQPRTGPDQPPPDTGRHHLPTPTAGRSASRRTAVIGVSVAAIIVIVAVAAALFFRTDVAGTGTAAAGSTAASPASPLPATSAPEPVPGLPHSTPLPDQVLVGSRSVDGSSNLYQYDAATGALGQQLTTGSPGTQFAILSPDRGSIIYLQTSPAGATLRTMAADGTGDRELFAQLPPDCTTIYRPAWNPIDQTTLALVCVTAEKRTALHRVRIDGTDLGIIDTGFPVIDDVTYSPDGMTLAFWGAEAADQPSTLFTMPADASGAASQLVDRGAGVGDADPVFSPDGSKIAFRRLLQDAKGNVTAQIILVNADGSNPVPLTDGKSADQDPIFSPDGRQIAFKSSRANAAGTADNQLWVINVDGTGLKELAVGSPGAGDGAPAWGHR